MAKTTTKQPVNDLTNSDFDRIRSMVRRALLSKGIDKEEITNLIRAHRTLQPVFSAATAYYKARRDDLDLTEHIAKANKAVNSAVHFLLNLEDETPEYPFN